MTGVLSSRAVSSSTAASAAAKALRLSFQFTNLTFDTVATGPAPGLLGALGSRTWLYPFFLYLLLPPLACVPPRQDSSPDRSGFRKEVNA